MKKIVVVFFILILGGAAFFFGWVQFRVPPGAYGVMRSKTHGVDTAVIREGEFRWVWFALIPTNAEVTVFTLKPVEQPIRVTGSLPSGDIYASLAGINTDFSYEYSGFLSFTLKPDNLPSLMTERGIANQEELEAFEKRIAGEIVSFSVQRLEEYAGEGNGLLESSTDKLKGDILHAYPYIENLFFTMQTVRYPDFALYRSTREIYEDYLAKQRETLEASISMEARFRLDELAKYGELLTKYPMLLQFLALQKGEDWKIPGLNGD
jgi:hypothetical protein